MLINKHIFKNLQIKVQHYKNNYSNIKIDQKLLILHYKGYKIKYFMKIIKIMILAETKAFQQGQLTMIQE